jgi:hypothetical protein
MACPTCGAKIKGIRGSGLATHQQGAVCIVRSTLIRFEKEGMAPLNMSQKPIMEEAGIPFEIGPIRRTIMVRAGVVTLAAKAGIYVPQWVADAWRLFRPASKLKAIRLLTDPEGTKGVVRERLTEMALMRHEQPTPFLGLWHQASAARRAKRRAETEAAKAYVLAQYELPL